MPGLTGLPFAVIAAVILSACSGASAPAGGDQGASQDETEALSFVGTDTADDEASGNDREAFDEDAARERAKEDVSSTGYTGSCTQDCSGHDAGFAYAADGNDDGGASSSQSFDEGQEAYDREVEDRVDEQRQEFEDSGEQEE